MQKFERVRSSQFGYPDEVDTKSSSTTVYIRSNIKRIDEENFKGWEYDEIQLSTDEYNRAAQEKRIDTLEYGLANAEYSLMMGGLL